MGAPAAPATAPSLPPPLGAGAARGARTRVRRLEKEAAREEAEVAREEAEAEAEEKEAKEAERVEEAEAARDPSSENEPASESGLPWDNLPSSGLSRSAPSPRWLSPLSSSGLTMWAAICRQ